MVESFSAKAPSARRCEPEWHSACRSRFRLPIRPAVALITGIDFPRLLSDFVERFRKTRIAQFRVSVNLVPFIGDLGLLREKVGILPLRAKHHHGVGLVLGDV